MPGLIASAGLGGLLSRESSWRRLLAFLVASGLLVGQYLTEETWLWVALAYIGTEGAQRIAETRNPRSSRSSSTSTAESPSDDGAPREV